MRNVNRLCILLVATGMTEIDRMVRYISQVRLPFNLKRVVVFSLAKETDSRIEAEAVKKLSTLLPKNAVLKYFRGAGKTSGNPEVMGKKMQAELIMIPSVTKAVYHRGVKFDLLSQLSRTDYCPLWIVPEKAESKIKNIILLTDRRHLSPGIQFRMVKLLYHWKASLILIHTHQPAVLSDDQMPEPAEFIPHFLDPFHPEYLYCKRSDIKREITRISSTAGSSLVLLLPQKDSDMDMVFCRNLSAVVPIFLFPVNYG